MTSAAELHSAKQAKFLTRLAETGQVTRSCVEIGWDRVQAYRDKAKDPKFAEAWTDALETFADNLEDEATRRAVTGTTKGIWHQGARVGEEQQYSDSLLALMLKAKRREYRDKVEVGNADDKPFKTELSPTEASRVILHAMALGLRQKAAGGAPDDSDSGEDMA
jgi:hypothetical protein